MIKELAPSFVKKGHSLSLASIVWLVSCGSVAVKNQANFEDVEPILAAIEWVANYSEIEAIAICYLPPGNRFAGVVEDHGSTSAKERKMQFFQPIEELAAEGIPADLVMGFIENIGQWPSQILPSSVHWKNGIVEFDAPFSGEFPPERRLEVAPLEVQGEHAMAHLINADYEDGLTQHFFLHLRKNKDTGKWKCWLYGLTEP